MSGLCPDGPATALGDSFRAALDALAKPQGEDPAMLSRAAIITLLQVLSDGLDPALIELRTTSEGNPFVIEHHAIGQLRDLMDALKDLDQGIVSDALRPANAGGGNRRQAKRREADELLVQATKFAGKLRGPGGVSIAEKKLIRAYRKYGGKPLTLKRIQSIRARLRRIQSLGES